MTKLDVTKCPYANHSTNINKFSHKILREKDMLLFSKEEYQNGIIMLYDTIIPALQKDMSLQKIMSECDKLLSQDIINDVNKTFNNYEVIIQIVAGIGHAIRTIVYLRDIYITLGGDQKETKKGIRKMIYTFATIGLHDIIPTSVILKKRDDLFVPIKNLPYDEHFFQIDEKNILQINPGLIDNMIGNGKCPAIGTKLFDNTIVIDDMIERLL